MEATFFSCPREDAVGVSAIDDLPCEPAGEPIRIESTGVLAALARTLCGEAASQVMSGNAKRAVGHATSGPCLQQNMVCVVESD